MRIGWESVKANAVPMVVLWVLAGALVVGYYFVPWFSDALGPLYRWQTSGGWKAAFLSRFFFCGLLPGFFLLLKNEGEPRFLFLTIIVQTIFAGACGIICDWMYTFHAWLLGTGIDVGTVVVKTMLNQFVWTPIVFVSMGSVVYFWIGCNLSLLRVRAEWPRRFLFDCYLPNLLTNWIVWIPVALGIHMFPTALQIQLSGLASAFLSLAFIALGRRIVGD